MGELNRGAADAQGGGEGKGRDLPLLPAMALFRAAPEPTFRPPDDRDATSAVRHAPRWPPTHAMTASRSHGPAASHPRSSAAAAAAGAGAGAGADEARAAGVQASAAAGPGGGAGAGGADALDAAVTAAEPLA